MYSLVKPALFRLDPETAHNVTFSIIQALGPMARFGASLTYGKPDARLETELAGMPLPGPIGLAAGLDKNGVLPRFWPTLGFGFVELGTVTALPQSGNPKPRLFRFPEHQALVNRMGFNNWGSESLARRLATLREGDTDGLVPIGVNIGKSKVTELEKAVGDYATSAERVAGHCDYVVVNVSSPNTPGLRKLQDPEFLKDILAAVNQKLSVPVFVKLSPDLTSEALREAVGVAESVKVAGIIATNTTIEHGPVAGVGAGGMSGALLGQRSLDVIGKLAEMTELPIVGVGGIGTVEGVLAALAAGAQVVQLYSALIFGGPGLISELNRGIVAEMDRRGISNINELRAALREQRSK
jgi:dihydroorotate dehydrogenase